MAQDPWYGILDKDEQILWQGAPAPGVQLEWDSAFHPLFYAFFTGFSVFWMVMASAGGGFFWTFGLLFFAVGAYGLVGVHFWRAYERRFTHYTLTSKRAIIAKSVFGRRKLESYPIAANTPLEFEESGPIGNIFFAEEIRRGRNSNYTVKIGFQRVKDPRDVYAKVRDVQTVSVTQGAES